MSHALGEVIKDGKVVGFFEYNGTSDIACSAVQKSVTDVTTYWRSPDNCRKCECGRAPESVILYSSYGGGFYWESTACFHCMAITGERIPEWCDAAGICHVSDGYPLESEPLEKEVVDG